MMVDGQEKRQVPQKDSEEVKLSTVSNREESHLQVFAFWVRRENEKLTPKSYNQSLRPCWAPYHQLEDLERNL